MIKCRDDVKLNMVFEGKLIPKYFDEGRGKTSVTLCDVSYELNITEDYKTLLAFPELVGLTEDQFNFLMRGVNL